MNQRWCATLPLLVFAVIICSLPSTAQQRIPEGQPWSEMDYGNFTTLSLEVSPGNIAYKGIAIRVDSGDGGVSRGSEFVMFETDTLRYAGGWTGSGFIDWRAIGLNGQHEIHPSIVGDIVFSNQVGPGWGRPSDGSFDDERVRGKDGLPYGPTARDWAHWKGLYTFGDRVVLKYTVGDTEVLEMPGAEGAAGQRVLSRTINLAPHTQELILQVADQKNTQPQLRAFDHPNSPNKQLAFFEDNENKPHPRAYRRTHSSTHPGNKMATVVAMVGGQTGMEWITTEDGDLRLRIPASAEPASLKLLFAHSNSMDSFDAFIATANASDAPANLEPFTHGGDERWPHTLLTKGTLGTEEGAYQIDTLTPPFENPYQSWLRFGGFDFFGDDSKAAIGTWNGDVWIVSGIDESLDNLTWKRIASGLFQPLGVKIVNDDVYVLGRDQITVLRDLNGDGETDFYENFNNDAQVTEHFHEFALDLQMGLDGDFYYTKGGRHNADSITPQHGTLLRVARDGSETEILARGFRAPNGLGIGPQGEFLTSDNEGHWTPANRINWVEPGRGDDTQFYGYRLAYIEGLDIVGYTPPLCWIPPAIDRSPGTFAWVPDRRWGPLRDRVVTISYGMGQMFHVMYEEIDGVVQGGVVKFPLEFDTGVCRVKFRRRDGQLYTCGLFGWAGNKTQWGGFYRVRYTGKDLYMPEEIHIAKDGLSLMFTDPLDPESATDVGNYGIKHWNYNYRKEYGSPQYKMDGTVGEDTLRATQAAISADRRTVYLKIPGIREVMQMEIKLNLKAADGTVVRHDIYNTINKMGTKTLNEMMGGGEIFSRKVKETVGTEGKLPGLEQTIAKIGEKTEDGRIARNPSLFVTEGETPSPFVRTGRFETTWKGFLEADLNQEFAFSLQGRGTARLRVNGIEAAALSGEGIATGEKIPVKNGVNAIELDYTAPLDGDATIQLLWESSDTPRGPIPPARFWHDDDDTVHTGEQLRQGRALLAAKGCVKCHAPENSATAAAWRMPELAMDAPTLDTAGAKFNEAWMAHWIRDPKAVRPDASMPAVFHGDDDALNAQQSSDVAAYLATLGPAKKKDLSHDLSGTAEIGETLFSDLGCKACHILPNQERTGDMDTRISLEHVGAKWKPRALAEFLANPERDYAWTRMPNFRLSDEESGSLVQFLLAEPAFTPLGPPGDVVRGRDLAISSGCLSCHTVTGQENTFTAPSLETLQASDWTGGCLAQPDAQRGSAPHFDLSEADRDALRAFTADGLDSLNRFVPSEFAARQVETLNCLACHSRDGRGDFWATLDPVETDPVETEAEELSVDDFFAEAQEADETIHVGRPPLDWMGEKLRPEWTLKMLAGLLEYKPRPGLKARMPGFPAYAEGMAQGLAAEHGFGPHTEPPAPFDAEMARLGRILAGEEAGFNCVSCHSMGSQKALAGEDTETINFALVPERLRRSYYERYLVDPDRLLPGTKMPQFINPDGMTALKGILEGDADRQFDALWNFFVQLNATTPLSQLAD